MTKYVVPTGATAQKMLEMLLGEKLTPGKGAALKPETCHVGTYVDDTGALVAICAVDLAFGAFSGAAMSGIPAAAAKDAIAEKALTENMLANLAEVMNILSRLLMSDTSPHLKFREVLSPGEQSELVKGLAGATRADMSISIPRYGVGNLSFLVS